MMIKNKRNKTEETLETEGITLSPHDYNYLYKQSIPLAGDFRLNRQFDKDKSCCGFLSISGSAGCQKDASLCTTALHC